MVQAPGRIEVFIYKKATNRRVKDLKADKKSDDGIQQNILHLRLTRFFDDVKISLLCAFLRLSGVSKNRRFSSG